ncbi:MAG: GntR family transcriptional regulator [Treponema sp.]|nr:GntR family transcriptional regulator [Treponema sp.]
MNNDSVADLQSLPPGLAQDSQGIPRYWQIYEHLLNEISTGKLNVGEQIPSEKELCETFQVSRITSKKAMEMLATNNFISRQRGKGSFVVETPASMELRKKGASFRVIAFLLSTLDDFFGKRLLCSVQAACEALGYQMILKLTHESPAEEEKALRALDNENVVGILMIPTQGEHYNAEILQQILKKRPLVFVDRKMWGLPVSSVTTDNIAASEAAVKGLLEKGHRNIAFYSGPLVHASTLKDRLDGFTKAFANTGFSLNPAYVCDTLHSGNDLDVIVRHLSDHPEITAAFATEFRIALMVKKAFAALGRSLSPDFALLTFDHPGYEDEFPEFTCLQQNEDEIGRQAVEILHRIIQGESDLPVEDILIPADMLLPRMT